MTRTSDEVLRDALAHLTMTQDYATRDLDDQLVIDAICMRLSAGIETLASLDASDRDALFGDTWPLMWGMRKGRAYYRRKLAAGKSRREAMRCLKRRISDALYRQLRADARAAVDAGPGGHGGASLNSSAAGLHPHTGTSDQPLPGPAQTTVPAPSPTWKTVTSRPLEPAS